MVYPTRLPFLESQGGGSVALNLLGRLPHHPTYPAGPVSQPLAEAGLSHFSISAGAD
jgi:hypothetical protein